MNNPKKKPDHFKVNTLGDYVAAHRILDSGMMNHKQEIEAMNALLDFADEHRGD